MVVLIRIFIFQVELNSVSSMDIHTEFFELSRAKHSRSQGLIWALRLCGFLFKRYKAINMKKLEQSMQCIHKFYNLTCSDNCFEYLSKWFSCISFALIWTLSLGAKLTYWRLKTLGHVTAKQEQVKATQHLWNLSLYFWLCHDVRYKWKKKTAAMSHPYLQAMFQLFEQHYISSFHICISSFHICRCAFTMWKITVNYINTRYGYK